VAGKVDRRTVDLSGYPDLVVIYLGMRVNALYGLKTLIGFGPRISSSVAARPDGLLLHENFIFSLFPPHGGMRQYWRDFDALERWARSEPHRDWWKRFLRDSGGTGFWHEAYFMRGGMEAVYDDMVEATGFLSFAPVRPARGAMFSARTRAARPGDATLQAPIAEAELYSDDRRI
jgi:fumigallin biosynthesis monooxygenase-like protein